MSAAQDEFNELFRDKDRRSRHPEDDNDSRSSSPARSPSPQNEVNDYDDDEGDNEDALARSAFAPSNARSNRTFLPSLKAHSNTGPKGVIADAHAFKDARHNHRISLSVSRTPVQEGFNELSLDDELDDDFMQSWRQSRLRELSGRGGSQSAQASEGQGGAAAARGQRRYGGLPRVDEEGFLEAVDGSGSHTVVVVFIYDDMVRGFSAFEGGSERFGRRGFADNGCRAKSASWLRTVSARLRGSTLRHASLKCITKTQRWRLQVYRLYWRTRLARSLLVWSPLWMRYPMMLI